MILPLQITARNIELTEAIRTNIEEKAGKLDEFYKRVMSCRVVVEAIPKRSLYNVNVDISVPGKELVIKREPSRDLYIAIRDAFDAAYRKLEDFARRQRGDKKHHEETPHARVSTMFLDDGYGFLTTPEGREIYFHENSVLGHGFKKLKVGTEVRFVESEGEKGPQASTVTPLE